jgi:hypothetical protein
MLLWIHTIVAEELDVFTILSIFPHFCSSSSSTSLYSSKDRLFQGYCFTHRPGLKNFFPSLCTAWLIFSAMKMEAADWSEMLVPIY